MIVKTEKLKQHLDEKFDDGTLIRHYARTVVKGWLASVRLTPDEVDFSDVLNVDVVISNVPTWMAGAFSFKYEDGQRLAMSVDNGCWGSFEHVHLSVNTNQINTLISNLGRRIRIIGDEVAVQKSGDSFFWVDYRALDWLNIPLLSSIGLKVRQLLGSGNRQCHSVSVDSISVPGVAGGSSMHSNFAAGAIGVTGFASKVVEGATKKAREKSKDHGISKPRQQTQQKIGDKNERKN